ncbi:MAG: 3-dehydroquinate synthase, partial [Prevotellaceae bacterium]|nr:3-dehydroquinate synthase [Prevotellaceae bacterium]
TVILDMAFLRTLDQENICSGYAEMLKHSLLCGTDEWSRHINFDLMRPDYPLLGRMVAQSVAIKQRIVEEDPTEKGIRKALNLGHTVGHAFESLALAENRTVLHGYAVAWGLVCELYLSACKLGFPTSVLQQTLHFVRDNYGWFSIECKEYDRLYAYMTHDKKNEAGIINFTLLAAPGDIRINQQATKEEIFEMLDFFRENG